MCCGVAGSLHARTPARRPPPPHRHRPRGFPRRPLVLAARAGGPRRGRLPEGRERPHGGGAGAAGEVPRGAVRRDEGPDQGDRHVGPGPSGPLVVLRPDRGGTRLRHPLPPTGPGTRRAPAGGRTGRGGADPARRERSGRGVGLLRRRERGGQSRPPVAGLLDRPGRGREVRAALQPPRRAAHPVRRRRSGARHLLRARLVGRRQRRLLRPHGRRPATLPTVAAPARLGPGGRRPGPRGVRPPLLARHRHHPRPGLGARDPAQHEHDGVARHPCGRSARRPGGRDGAARRSRVRARPPALRRRRVVRRPHQRLGVGFPGPGRPGRGTGRFRRLA